jgi:hypothetical protein
MWVVMGHEHKWKMVFDSQFTHHPSWWLHHSFVMHAFVGVGSILTRSQALG